MESILENKLMTSYKDEMISFLREHPEHFDEAIQLAISDKQPYSWRATFLLWGCIEKNDARILKYVPVIVKTIKNKKDGHQRELIKILSKMKIEEKYEGRIFDLCMNLWEDISKQPSVRITALKYILKTAGKHPELMNEINCLLQDQFMSTLSPGVKHSVRLMMEEMNLKPEGHG